MQGEKARPHFLETDACKPHRWTPTQVGKLDDDIGDVLAGAF